MHDLVSDRYYPFMGTGSSSTLNLEFNQTAYTHGCELTIVMKANQQPDLI